ncbi:hypothetical protein HDU67_003511 [Dinochytrium kinnereticum]|nr:hypothetical protein HDU67_003511 [Dinochytrium kinnereticum]
MKQKTLARMATQTGLRRCFHSTSRLKDAERSPKDALGSWITSRPSVVLNDCDTIDPSRVHLLNLTLHPDRPWTLLRPSPFDLYHKRPQTSNSEVHHLDMGKTLGHHHSIDLPSTPQPKPIGFALPPAWHLILFPPRNLESDISPDGYDMGPLSPPKPFVHRKWASGEFSWPLVKRGGERVTLRVGDNVNQVATVEKVERKKKRAKGGEEGSPGSASDEMVFVWQKRCIGLVADSETDASTPLVVERRCHVYTAASSPARAAAMVPEPHPTFDVEIRPPTPSMVTLFRYSALTFNSHKIHLDNDFATKVEGQPGALVHGPLTATLLVDLAARVIALASANETDLAHRQLEPVALESLDPFFLFESPVAVGSGAPSPRMRLSRFSYRATAPLVVGREVSLRARVAGVNRVDVWALDATTGNVVMVGVADAEAW